MLRLLLVAAIIILMFLSGSTFIACKKEAKCDCKADTITIAKIIQPDGVVGKDAVIDSISPDQNNGNSDLFSVFAWTNAGFFDIARALIEFDLSAIPPQTKIKGARLSLYWNSSGNLIDQTGDNVFSIYRITQEWDENTVTWNNQPAISNLHKVTVPKSTSPQQSYIDVDVTELIQDGINNPQVSHGFMLKLDQEFPYRLIVLASSDCADATKRPKLVVYY